MLAPVSYWGALSYGVESRTWDSEFACYEYGERPGGVAVADVGVAVAALLAMFAACVIAAGVKAAVREHVRKVRQSAQDGSRTTPPYDVAVSLSEPRSYP